MGVAAWMACASQGHVKCLRLDGEYEKDAFNELIAVVPHLRRLEGFAVPMDGTCLPQTVLKSMRTHCPRFDSVSLFFRDDFDASDEDLEATFALEGLKHFAIISWEISPSENWRDNSLPPSIIKALRASPALETLHLAIGIENYREWDVHQTFAELSGAHFPRLRALAIREQADLNCWKLCDATDPFLQFLHAHHAQLETLALPSTCAYGPTSLRLPAHFFPSLTAFEGSGFLCRQLSELPHPAARLKRLAMLWDEDNDDDQAQLLGTLRAYSALEALWISPTDTMSLTHTPAQLHVLAQAAPNLTELRTGVNLSENDVNLDDLAPALAAFSHLQTLCVRVAILTRNTPTKPEEFVASLAAHCPHLQHCDRHWAVVRALGSARQPPRRDY
ncbi:hypothetical protein C8J57DRAFT_60109 [Mycena rebaudengoi]|nr:hypothetical protein C8J57DRAFT_60109 [Mycena rebaudengoi]